MKTPKAQDMGQSQSITVSCVDTQTPTIREVGGAEKRLSLSTWPNQKVGCSPKTKPLYVIVIPSNEQTQMCQFFQKLKQKDFDF